MVVTAVIRVDILIVAIIMCVLGGEVEVLMVVVVVGTAYSCRSAIFKCEGLGEWW